MLFILFNLWSTHRTAVKWSNNIFLFFSFSNAFFVFRNSNNFNSLSSFVAALINACEAAGQGLGNKNTQV